MNDAAPSPTYNTIIQAAPQYVAPPPDPGLALLAEQNQRQQVASIQDRVSAASARLMQQYGTRLASSGSSWSPLIAPPATATSPLTPAPLTTAAPVPRVPYLTGATAPTGNYGG